LSLTLLNEYHIVPGEIVCQCAERSLSMVIGIMGIEMAGGVYCPLPPRDPRQRLHALIQQTQSRLVLVHWLTKSKFNNKMVSIDTHLAWINNDKISDINVDQLSNITVTHNDIAYIIFTSGSTGLPKVFDNANAIKHLRCLCSVGEPIPVKLRNLIANIGIPHCTVWNIYGSTELTVASTYHLVDINSKNAIIPVGKSLPNYRSFVLNKFFQSIPISQKGELFIGGVGVFAGYLGRDDLTAKALIEIDGEVFYRIGDLVTMDNNGLLHYQGRKDHQIKLRGQRIELGEIERCLLNITSISACVVIKWNDDYLVAYVQTYDSDQNQLQKHCQTHLPPHMIPSIFIILDKLPLNPNGKIDRKLLPAPNFSSIQLTNNIDLLTPSNEIEVSLHRIWCDILKQKQISVDKDIFSIGGHSLVIMKLLHRYKVEFHLETGSLSIADLFQRPTIIDHAKIIHQISNIKQSIHDCQWLSLYLTQAPVSYAQERIFLDEKIRFSSTDNNTNIYVIPLIYRLPSVHDHISISRLQHAFQNVIIKHTILRTVLYLDINGIILQDCQPTSISINDTERYRFSVVNMSEEDDGENDIIKKILNQSDLFDLSKGHVINCHILRHCGYSRDNILCKNNDLLTKDDLILFTIHHAMFDGASTS
ncbi:unnamed protein product, partial [Adineta steineri]